MQQKITLLTFALREITQMQAAGRLGNARNYRCACNSFQRYLKACQLDDLTFRQMTPERMLSYQDWLWTNGISRNSSSCYMRCLHAIYNRAVRQGLASGNPFTQTYTGIAKTHKRAIHADAVKRLSKLHIADALIRQGKSPGHKPFSENVRQLEFARDLFLFCFSARGMTFVDLAHLRPSDINHGHIYYTRRKTRQLIVVRIEPIMLTIIHKYHSPTSPYLFPILTSLDRHEAYTQYRKALRTYNAHLQQLSTLLGSDISLSSYVSRHTWATIAYHQQVPISVISQAMGHDSERTTQIYLKSLENSVIDEANHNLLKKIFSPLLC